MPEREEALSEALEAGINILKKSFGDDYDRALVLRNVPMLLEVMWPILEGAHEHSTVTTFEECFKKRFPNHVLTSYGGTVLDYIVGNVQSAVADEIILMMETWLATMEEASTLPGFKKTTNHRDWEVGESHVRELISEVKQYRSRGTQGHHSTHTGAVHIQEHIDARHNSTPASRGERD